MPPVSDKQARAMHAAAEGHSTLGIPASVGKEFVGGGTGDDPPKHSLMDDLHDVRLSPMHKLHKKHSARRTSTQQGTGHSDHDVVHDHLDKAKAASTTDEKRGHVFNALSALNAIQRPTKKSALEQASPESAGPPPTHPAPEMY